MKGIILAAGYATRLYPLTKDRPKALLPVGGRPIIDYIVDEINTIREIDQIIVISNHRFAEHFLQWARLRSQRNRNGAEIVIVDDGTVSDEDKLGAVGDIGYCLDKFQIDDDVLVIAGDNLFTYKLLDAYDYFKKRYRDMILIKKLPPEENPGRFAIVTVDPEGIVTDMEEKPAHPKSDLAAYATYFYRRDTLPLFGKYLSSGHNPDAPGNFPVWLHKNKELIAYEFDGICIDIGTHESYQDVMTAFPPVHQ